MIWSWNETATFSTKQYRGILTEVSDNTAFPKRVIASGNFWVYGYDIETNPQLFQRKFSKTPPNCFIWLKWTKKTIHRFCTTTTYRQIPVWLSNSSSQQSYSPGITLCDFSLFPKLRMAQKRKYFQQKVRLWWNRDRAQDETWKSLPPLFFKPESALV